jgi:hypothetical protein
MSCLSRLWDRWTGSHEFDHPSRPVEINPASGLPMSGGTDIGGNVFGSNPDHWQQSHDHHDHWTHYRFDDQW